MPATAASRSARLTLLALLLGAALAPLATAQEEATPPVLSRAALVATALFDAPPQEWWEPPVVASEDHALSTRLVVDYADHEVIDHTGARVKLHLRSYNGQILGPTLRARAGDTLYVQLNNRLPQEPHLAKDGQTAEAAHHAAMSACPNVPHDFNTTNLHTHGLHISPTRPSDDVFLDVGPKQSFDYVFKILPAGNPGPGNPVHYPGTFWYHAHRHGSTAMQLASGMAGALIIVGDVDEVPEIKTANERLFVFQQIAYGKDGKIEDFTQLFPNWSTVVNEHTRINGRLKPRFTMRPGQIERWRMIDSGLFADVPFHLVPANPGQPAMQIAQIAVDGITLPAPRKLTQIDLGPGQRTDLLVSAPTAKGTYYLRKLDSKFDFTGVGAADRAEAQILAEIVVDGDPCTRQTPGCGGGVPARLPAPTAMLPDIPERIPVKDVTFSVEVNPAPTRFLIENECFDPDKVLPKFDLELGAAEEWLLHNTSEGVHPYHIHVNAFQVIEADGTKTWRDTVVIPPKSTVRIRSRFERFSGDFVTHCHILIHEDKGMMQRVRIR